MCDPYGLILTYLKRDPGKGLKRLRDVAYDELWNNPGEDAPDFSMLPKDVWGMIVERCEVSRESLTTLLLLNKTRLSAVVWKHFRFSPKWNYWLFVDRLMFKQKYRKGREPCWFELFGLQSWAQYFIPVEKFASALVAKNLCEVLEREDRAQSKAFALISHVSTETHVLQCVTKLLSLYRPHLDCAVLCSWFHHLGCVVSGELPEIGDILLSVPDDLKQLAKPLTNLHIALGYYAAYRTYTKRDYGVTLPEIKAFN